MKTSIGITEKNREVGAEILSELLADEFVLYVKLRNAHWNVEGPDFHTMHVYFEEVYHEIENTIDEVAERIRQIGHYAPATLRDYIGTTHLSEERTGKNDSLSFIKDLVSDFESIIITLREGIEKLENTNDFGTADFLTSIIEEHEKTAWMLRAHLK